MGRKFPLPSQLEGLGERRELPQQGLGQSPGRKLILLLSKRQRMLLVEMFVIN